MDFTKLMKNAKDMQDKMQQMQMELADKEFIGNAGASLVKVTINGKFELRKVSIDNSLLKETEKELLEDLLVAAFADAKAKVDNDSQNSMSNLMQNIGLPSGFKLPF